MAEPFPGPTPSRLLCPAARGCPHHRADSKAQLVAVEDWYRPIGMAHGISASCCYLVGSGRADGELAEVDGRKPALPELKGKGLFLPPPRRPAAPFRQYGGHLLHTGAWKDIHHPAALPHVDAQARPEPGISVTVRSAPTVSGTRSQPCRAPTGTDRRQKPPGRDRHEAHVSPARFLLLSVWPAGAPVRRTVPVACRPVPPSGGSPGWTRCTRRSPGPPPGRCGG